MFQHNFVVWLTASPFILKNSLYHNLYTMHSQVKKVMFVFLFFVYTFVLLINTVQKVLP